MTLPPFDHQRATSLEEALSAVDGGAVPYCGGTELLGAMALGLLRPGSLVSLRSVPDLYVLERDGDVVRLGAALTHQDLSSSPLVRSASPLLAEVTRHVGNIRVRSTGTIGGNIAFAEPRSDVSTTLLALEGRVILQGPDGQRLRAIDELILGPYEADLLPGELLVAFEVPAEGVDVGVYRKVTITERPVVGVALVRVAAGGQWRLVVGAVGEVPHLTESDDLDSFDPAAVAEAVDVVPDHSGSERYKRRLVCVTVTRCLDEARQRVTEMGA